MLEITAFAPNFGLVFNQLDEASLVLSISLGRDVRLNCVFRGVVCNNVKLWRSAKTELGFIAAVLEVFGSVCLEVFDGGLNYG